MNQPLASGALPHNFSMDAVFSALKLNGAVVIPTDAFDIESFSRLIQSICRRITFDPAREYASSAAQTVDAGTAAVGLHIENGNTPLPPDIVSFYSARSAKTGAQTTLCDGIAVLAQMPKTLVSQFEKPFSMTRTLPKAIWQRYVATAFGLANADEVEQVHLDRFINAVPGQSYAWAEEASINYRLEINAIRSDNMAATPSFANALLGPSYNYEPPTYRFSDGAIISQDILDELAVIGEENTVEIPWRDGDVAIIDNKRVMHGRREITVPLAERKLFIAMGLDIVHCGQPS